MNDEIQKTRQKITEIGALLFQRNLTDSAGGNISVRVDDLICMTPAYSGHLRQWQLSPNDVLVLNMEGELIEGAGLISRETKAHISLHQNFREFGNAVIHCHARNVMVFAALARPIPPVLEATQKFGEIPVADYAPSHSEDLATFVTAAMRPQAPTIAKHAAAVLAPWHGLFAMGKSLDATFDAVERIDTNAYCIIMGQSLGGSEGLLQERTELQERLKPYSGS